MLKYCFLAFSCLLICSCKKSSKTAPANKPSITYPNLQLSNYSADTLHIQLDNDTILLPPEENLLKSVTYGKHRFISLDIDTTFQLRKDEKLLINPTRDSIIVEEILYSSNRTIYTRAEEKDYQTPSSLLRLNDRWYQGRIKSIRQDLFIKSWDYGIEFQPFGTINETMEYYKNVRFLERISHFYKLYTVSEFKRSRKDLNSSNDFINIILKNHLVNADIDYTFRVEQVNFLVVKPLKEQGGFGSIAQASVHTDDQLKLRNVILYNPKKHGKITKNIGRLENCHLQLDDGSLELHLNFNIVYSDNTHLPHLQRI